MTNKIFSTYKGGKERLIKNSDRLIVEISNAHVACLVIGGDSNNIEDFELFELPADSFKTFEESFAYVVIGSRLLDKQYSDKKVFINTVQSVLVPAHLYTREKSEHYLNVVFGNNRQEIFKDDLNNWLQAVNIYRVPLQLKEVIEKNLAMVTVEHTYTNILRSMSSQLTAAPNGLIKARFYTSHFIVIVAKESELKLINSYFYTTPDDVLYQLLNISRQFDLNGVLLQVSGMVDLKFSMYEQLNKYFSNLTLEEDNVSELELQGYPSHYFTPFFKLAE